MDKTSTQQYPVKPTASRTPDNPDPVVTTTTLAGRELAPRPTSAAAVIALPNGMWERIAKQAYELWERCGCREDHDLQDWLDAEKIVMKEMHEARE